MIVFVARHVLDRQRHQRRDHQQGEPERQPSRRPCRARPAHQGERNRCRDQYPQRVASPPRQPGDRQVVKPHGSGQAERSRCNAGTDEAGRHRTQAEEPRDVRRLRQGERLPHKTPHQGRAHPGLQPCAEGNDGRHSQGRQLQISALRTQCQVDKERTQARCRRHAPAKHQHARQCHPRCRKNRRRIARWNGQHQPGQSGHQVGGRGHHGGQCPMNLAAGPGGLLSKCGFATLFNPRGGRTTFVVGLGAFFSGH